MPCFMSGTVRSTDGEPIPGALLDIWQADEDGFYDVQYEDLDEARGRGHLHSADDGRYWFWTVQPEAYPIPTDGPVGSMLAATSRSPMRPAHVHFKVTAPGYQTLITHVFDESDQYLDTDAVFGVRSSLLGDLRAPRARHRARRPRDDRAVAQRAVRPHPGAGGLGAASPARRSPAPRPGTEGSGHERPMCGCRVLGSQDDPKSGRRRDERPSAARDPLAHQRRELAARRHPALAPRHQPGQVLHHPAGPPPPPTPRA